jgi:integrase
MHKSNASRSARKPAKPQKPRADFPLYAHATKRWAKKVRGRTHFFGPWDDPQGALLNWLSQRDDLLAGRRPKVQVEGLTVRELCDRFLSHKRRQVERPVPEICPRTFAEYFEIAKLVVNFFRPERLVIDLAPDDFVGLLDRGLPSNWGPHRRGKAVQVTRMIFKFADDMDLLDGRRVRMGKAFRKPSNKVMRLHRAKQGVRLFEAAELRAMLDKAGPQLRCMFLLAINCGFGNGDVASLPIAALDLDGGWVNYPRPKTGIARRCRLWPETIQALRDVIATRPAAKDERDAGLVFVTGHGKAWVRVTTEKVAEEKEGGDVHARLKVRTFDGVSKETMKVLKRLDINGHRNFYTLRHTFRTVADETRDQPAVDSIMGHVAAAGDMASVYRERIGDDRLAEVSAHVRRWLFAEVAKA